ncbi:MAG: CRISPR-associated protein Cas4 [Hyphomicrobiaceae bacterium]|nr:MAG: CRISPR-associated protein Cas4 [Hyphomicrobiaceae bacterium]
MQGEGKDADLIPLSALQHYLFCPRQCALIHVEQLWSENRFTAEGRLLHEATAQAGTQKRRGIRTVTAMPIASRRLGVSGIADVVEMHKDEAGRWRPFPVEYKRGKPKAHRADEVQLCAQAIALEEMFTVDIAEGALFYGATRRRVSVALDAELRRLTGEVAAAARAMIAAGATPAAIYEKRKCGACSLIDLCRPKELARSRSAAAWLSRCIEEV